VLIVQETSAQNWRNASQSQLAATATKQVVCVEGTLFVFLLGQKR